MKANSKGAKQPAGMHWLIKSNGMASRVLEKLQNLSEMIAI